MRYTSTSTTTILTGSGPKKASGPISVGLTLNATGQGDNVSVGLATQAKSTGSGNSNFSLNTKAKSGKVDKLAVKLAVGDWAREKGDGDDLDFLICISGAPKGGANPPHVPAKKLKDIDLRLDLALKGVPLEAVFKPGTVEGLKLVKCTGPDGKPGWGYIGTVDADARVLKLALNSAKSGEKVAELALDLSAGHDDHPLGDL